MGTSQPATDTSTPTRTRRLADTADRWRSHPTLRRWTHLIVPPAAAAAAVWFAPGTPADTGTRLLYATSATLATLCVIAAFRWLRPRLGRWTSILALALAGAALLFVVASTSTGCYDLTTGAPQHCTISQASEYAGSVLLLPIMAALLILPILTGLRWTYKGARAAWKWGRKPIVTVTGGNDKDTPKPARASTKASAAGTAAAKLPTRRTP